MSRSPASLVLVLAIAIAGCATAPPRPPLAEPVVLSPDERNFQHKGFAWSPGIVITYSLAEYSETTQGRDTVTQSKRHVHRLTAHERTAAGLVRVRLRVDDADLADLFFSSAGVVTDASALPAVPEAYRDDVAKMVAHAWQHPVTRRYRETMFTLDAPLPFELAFSEALGPFGRFVSGGMMRGSSTFMGRRRLAGVVAVHMRTLVDGTSPVRLRVATGNRAVDAVVAALTAERDEYFDVRSGLLLARYETFTFSWDEPRRGAITRSIVLTTLDRAASRGI